MDALALLCNLHGNGPATLAGLRELGVRELACLEALEDGDLERLLGGAAPAAVRFRREGRLLRERLEGPLADPVEAAADPDPCPDPVAPPPVPAHEPAPADCLEPDPVGDEPAPTELRPRPAAEAPQAPPTHADQDPVVRAVLGLWNHLDGVAAPDERGDTLAESTLEGLRPEEVVHLAQAGIRTLAELAACDALVVSGQVPIPYTHLSHLAFLARRELREAGALADVPVTPREADRPGTRRATDLQGDPAPRTTSPAGPRGDAVAAPGEALDDDGPAGPFA